MAAMNPHQGSNLRGVLLMLPKPIAAILAKRPSVNSVIISIVCLT